MIKPVPTICSVFAYGLVLGLTVSLPTPTFAHVGHGDEFQAEGGINRVPVKAETDSLLGITVTEIAPAANGSSAVLIPVTSVVDADGKQIVFVQYNNFYEPVPITTGATEGELVEVSKGLSVGEKLVTQGSLSLYAESRKTQNAEASSTPVAEPPVTSPEVPNTTAQAEVNNTQQNEFPTVPVAIGGVAVLAVGGAIAVLTNSKNQRGQ
ncbi:MAG: cobalt transporter [Pseudanabaenaceae cyanobacterium bins.68]|nr:cobalt transporter [Pseudanabaenaceae cyanobacterium bins.68]